MFDELAEAVYREKITQLETLVQRKNGDLAELRREIEGSALQAQADSGAIAERLKERESELTFISKELTEREREVEQLKHLAEHLAKRLDAERQTFEQDRVQIHSEYEERIKDQQNQIVELEEHIGRLQETIEGLREREQELSESRESLAQEYESQFEDLRVRLQEFEAVRTSASANEGLLDLARQEIEQFRNRTKALEGRDAKHEEQVRDLNQSLASAQQETMRLSTEIEAIQEVAKQQRVELEREIEEERARGRELEERYQKEVADLNETVEQLHAEVETRSAKEEDEEDLRGQLEAAEERRQDLERDYTERLEAFEREFEEAREQLGLAESKGAEAEARRSRLEAEQEIHEGIEKQHRVQIHELEDLVASLRGEIENAREARARETRPRFASNTELEELEQTYAEHLGAVESRLEALRCRLEVVAPTNEQAEGLQVEVEVLQEQLSSAERARQAQIDALAALHEVIDRNDSEIRTLRELHEQIEDAEFQASVLKERLYEKDQETAELNRIVDVARSEIDLLQSRLRESEEGRSASAESAEALRKECEDLNQIHQEWMELMTADIAELEGERGRSGEEVERMQTRIAELETAGEELDAARARIADLETSLGQEERAIQELVDRNLQTQRELSDRHTAMESARIQMQQLQESLREAEKANQDLQARTAMMDQDLQRARAALGTAEARMGEMKQTYESRIETVLAEAGGGGGERTALLVRELEDQSERLEATEADLATARRREEGLEEALVGAQSSLDRVQKERTDLEYVLSDERALVEELSRKEAQNREEVQQLWTRLNEAQLRAAEASRTVAEAPEEPNDAAAQSAVELEQAERAVRELQSQGDVLRDRVAELETEGETLRSTIAAHVSEVESLRQQTIPELERERDRLIGEREELMRKLAAVEDEREQYRVESELVLEQANVLQSALEEERARAQNAEGEKGQLESALADERALAEQMAARTREDGAALESLRVSVGGAEKLSADLEACFEEQRREMESAHQESMGKLQQDLDERGVVFSQKEGELLEVLDVQRSTEENLHQALELNEALESMIESQKAELSHLAKVELPAALEARERSRQERDDAREEAESVREQRDNLLARADELEGSLDSSKGTVRDFEEQLSKSQLSLREMNHELEEEAEERERLDQWKMRSLMAHAATLLLGVGLVIYMVGKGPSVPDEAAPLGVVRPAEGVADRQDGPTVPGTVVGEGTHQPVVEDDTASAEGSEESPGYTPGEAIPALEPVSPIDAAEAIEEEIREFVSTGEGALEPVVAEIAPVPVAPPAEPKRYKLKKGDSLWIIAKREYGDPLRWKDIAKANDLKAGDIPRIRPGRELILP